MKKWINPWLKIFFLGWNDETIFFKKTLTSLIVKTPNDVKKVMNFDTLLCTNITGYQNFRTFIIIFLTLRAIKKLN